MNWYYYDKNGAKVGPISTAVLKQLAQQGLITQETRIENQAGRSATAGQVGGLEFPPPPTAPVAPSVPVAPPQQIPTFSSPPPVAPVNLSSVSRAYTMNYERNRQYFKPSIGCATILMILGGVIAMIFGFANLISGLILVIMVFTEKFTIANFFGSLVVGVILGIGPFALGYYLRLIGKVRTFP